MLFLPLHHSCMFGWWFYIGVCSFVILMAPCGSALSVDVLFVHHHHHRLKTGHGHWKVSKEQSVPWLHWVGAAAQGVWSLPLAVWKVPGIQPAELHNMDEGNVTCMFSTLSLCHSVVCFLLSLSPSLSVMLTHAYIFRLIQLKDLDVHAEGHNNHKHRAL